MRPKLTAVHSQLFENMGIRHWRRNSVVRFFVTLAAVTAAAASLSGIYLKQTIR
jgi:UDP-N-acetylmuramyl pentapeptide phosphotransferase/UDP-N-acetylglucosamine-1-phosphate transferase